MGGFETSKNDRYDDMFRNKNYGHETLSCVNKGELVISLTPLSVSLSPPVWHFEKAGLWKELWQQIRLELKGQARSNSKGVAGGKSLPFSSLVTNAIECWASGHFGRRSVEKYI